MSWRSYSFGSEEPPVVYRWGRSQVVQLKALDLGLGGSSASQAARSLSPPPYHQVELSSTALEISPNAEAGKEHSQLVFSHAFKEAHP